MEKQIVSAYSRRKDCVRVLVADADLNVHQLVKDLLEINFKDVKIDRALSGSSFITKVTGSAQIYDLILCNAKLDHEEELILTKVKSSHPAIADRIVVIADSHKDREHPHIHSMPFITRPFSLDYFGEVVNKTCAA